MAANSNRRKPRGKAVKKPTLLAHADRADGGEGRPRHFSAQAVLGPYFSTASV
jgi:hypothetical protein